MQVTGSGVSQNGLHQPDKCLGQVEGIRLGRGGAVPVPIFSQGTHGLKLLARGGHSIHRS